MTIYILTNAEDTFNPADRKWANCGGSTELITGKNNYGASQRGFIRFDLSELPPTTAVVNSAVVSMLCFAVDSDAARLIALHRSLVQWYEGTKGWQAPEDEDGSTWNYRNAKIGEELHWVGGYGSGGVSGDDWDGTKTDDVSITTPGERHEWDVSADIDDFLKWL